MTDYLAGTGIGGDALSSVMGSYTPQSEAFASALATPQPQASPTPVAAPILPSGKMISVISPDGKAGEVPSEKLEQALAIGYKPETQTQAAVREYVDENRGLSGTAKVALHSLANQALFGIPEIIQRKTGDPLEVAKHEALAKEHEYASAAGGLTGFGASLFIGGPLFKAAGKAGVLAEQAVTRGLAGRLAAEGVAEGAAKGMARALVEKAAASGAKMGVEGAVIAAPQAITEAALGDPQQAAESLLFGLGAGAALGVVGGAGKEMLSRAVQKAGGAGVALEKYADEQALKSLDPLKRVSDRLGEIKDAGKIVRELGLVRQVNEEAADLAARAQGVRSEVGGRIDEIYKGVKSTFDGTAMAEKLRADVVEPLAGKVGYQGHTKKIAAYVDDFAAKYADRPVTAEELVQVRRDLDGLIYGERMPGPEQIDKQYKAARDIFKDVLDSRVKSELGEGSLAELHKLNSQYRVASLVDKAATDNIGRAIKNRGNSLTDYMLGGAQSVAGASAGAVVGGPVGGLIGSGVGQLVGMFGNKYLRANYNSIASSTAEKLGLLLTEQTMRKAALEADRIPSLFGELAARKTLESGAHVSPAASLEQIFGTSKYDDIVTKLSQATAESSPRAVVSGLADGGAPEISKAYAQKQIEALQYLQQHLPVDTRAPVPFTKPAPYQPTRAEWASFSRRAETVANPYVVFDRIADGTLGREHVDALQTIYPKLYENMKNRIATESTKSIALDYVQRAAVRLLVGASQPPVNWQTDFAGQQKKPPAPKLPKGGGGAVGVTDIQRITG